MFSAENYKIAEPFLQIGFHLFLIYSAIQLLKTNYAREIYLIWYYNSFFFLVFFGMALVAEQRKVPLTRVCEPREATCKAIYDYLTNIDDELSLVAVIVALSIGPQLLTYLLSGLSGTASAPKFVAQIQSITVWSLVKFVAGLGGILTAQPLAKLAAGSPIELKDFRDFAVGFSFTAIGFTWAATYIAATENAPAFFRAHYNWARAPFRALVKIHRFFTRHVRREPLDKIGGAAQDRALPKI